MPNEEQIRKIVDERIAVILGPEASKIITQKPFQRHDGRNIQLGVTTGTKIGTTILQKLGFFNTEPVIQQSSTGQAAGFTGQGGTAVTHTDTFNGVGSGNAYTIGDIVRHLKAYGFLA